MEKLFGNKKTRTSAQDMRLKKFYAILCVVAWLMFAGLFPIVDTFFKKYNSVALLIGVSGMFLSFFLFFIAILKYRIAKDEYQKYYFRWFPEERRLPNSSL